MMTAEHLSTTHVQTVANAKEEAYEFLFKVVLIGNSGVGKSKLLSGYATNEFTQDHNHKSTVGVEFATRIVTIEGRKIKGQFWDTAGQERYRSIGSAYYRGALGALLVYDITDMSSFTNADIWLKEFVTQTEDDVVVMLVGNKSDLAAERRSVPTKEAQTYAERKGLLFMETSAFDSTFVDAAFTQLLTEIYHKFSLKAQNQKIHMSDTITPSLSKTQRLGQRDNGTGDNAQVKKSCC